MPFQVNFSFRRRMFGQINSANAGDDQIHICTPIVYLEAIVDGDLIGHSIEWEQISGTAVTLQNANTLTPYFDYVDGTDKKFRFWIDRGTPEQQYDDVIVYRTPTAFCSAGLNNTQQASLYPLDPPPIECSSLTANAVVTVPPPTSLQGEKSGSITDIIISWNHPGASTDIHIEQYRVIENEIEVGNIPPVPIPDAGDIGGLAGGPPSDPLEYYGTLALYRIDTHYNIGGKKFVRESCTQDFTSVEFPLVRAYNDSVRGVELNPVQQKNIKTLFLFININKQSFTTVGFIPTQQSTEKTSYTFTILTNNESSTMTGFSSDQQTINITRYGGTGIGG